MPKLSYKLPEKYWVACSGGIDSVFALDFLDKPSRKKSLLGVIHINHGTDYASRAEEFVAEECNKREVEFRRHSVEGEPPKGESREKYWRDERYRFFHSYEEPIILAHNFDDCLEEYVMSTMVRGFTGTIPACNKNCVRPFRYWKRRDIRAHAKKHGLGWIEDPSNRNTQYKRNYIRHEVVPKLLELNPGVYNIVGRLIEKGICDE